MADKIKKIVVAGVTYYIGVDASNVDVSAGAGLTATDAQTALKELNDYIKKVDNGYVLYIDSEGYVCCQYDNLKTIN